mmetsp:Transcript_33149/g.33758  ORF Transcript_33149/g.33758 Transcript_33149/m.33758 type:complete len:252 (+) Transcript_33149:373-1128(+)|eukprot:CAMPEP_0182428806 /NCGR_PEP_ID=MMETSP1167-20130531/23778_1 /TAXON_ID=2988 /ORGANISM="Mallomonas Sp, Strain CCMP3275" /LENGTH=251 /DNA_ID=CAMNT_0024611925 /DNA_START=275 /DNA_END=1030 /DNA_ORIENTATION=+
MPKRKAETEVEGKIVASKVKRESKPVSRLGIEDITVYSSPAIAKRKNHQITVSENREPIPSRNKDNQLVFRDYPNFRPNLSPKEVIQAGSFGGTYFRPIYSSITGKSYDDVWKEFPGDWFDGVNIKKYVTSSKYLTAVNTYKADCGQGLEEWERSGWITEIDPYGWFQWYCRFYLGRRCSDDERQLSRGMGVMGPKGRWRNNLINKCLSNNAPLEDALNNYAISPKVRQLLQHWAYRLTLKDLQSALKKKK